MRRSRPWRAVMPAVACSGEFSQLCEYSRGSGFPCSPFVVVAGARSTVKVRPFLSVWRWTFRAWDRENGLQSVCHGIFCRLSESVAPSDRRLFMAKKSWLEKDKRKRATVAKYAAVRAELKANNDYVGLSQLPRDASPTRLVNRCEVSGRRRAFIRRFRISRIVLRELAASAQIPGLTKASW